MTAGPAPLTPVPMVVKMPPPIIVPKPIATRSLAVSARRKILRRPSSRSLSTLVVANSWETKDIRRRFVSKDGLSPTRMVTVESDPYRRIGMRELYRNPWLAVEAHDIVHPNGAPGEHVLVVTPRACGVVVEDGSELLFARQPRFGARRFVLEIVKGGGDAGESSLQSAQRELREELGVVADHWVSLGSLYEIPSIVNEPVALFVARGVTYVAPEPEAEESIDLVRMDAGEALNAAAAGVA